MLFLALAGITGVCLAFAELRLLAVVGLAALLFLNPLLTLALFSAVAVACFVLKNSKEINPWTTKTTSPKPSSWSWPGTCLKNALADAVNEQAKLMAGLLPRGIPSLALSRHAYLPAFSPPLLSPLKH
jgi:hypothetical protein